MIWAIQNNQKVTATPNSKAICPVCNAEVISKCGSIKIWHWSHLSVEDCDSWSEGETEWHFYWKYNFPKEQQEVIIGKHRADIKTNKTIIELQNSSISAEEIKERENYNGNMIWLLNGDKFAKNLELRCKGSYFTFRWKHPPQSWWESNKEIYIDLSSQVISLKEDLKKYKEMNGKKDYDSRYGCIIHLYDDLIKYIEEKIDLYTNNIFLIKKIHKQCPCGGWGIILSKEEFLKQFR